MTPQTEGYMEKQQPTNTGEPDDTGKKLDTRFKPGQSGNPTGRPKGARSKLATQFLDDLVERWEEDGKKALELCAKREPTQFVKVVKDLLPREVLVAALNINTTIDPTQIESAEGFLAAYRYARDRIGAPLIEAEPVEAEEGALITDALEGVG
jgi:hypothetical protein